MSSLEEETADADPGAKSLTGWGPSPYLGWALCAAVAAILVVPMWNWLGPRPTLAIAVGMGTFFMQLWVRRIRGQDRTAPGGLGRGGDPQVAGRRRVRGFNRQLVIALSASLLAWYLAESLD